MYLKYINLNCILEHSKVGTNQKQNWTRFSDQADDNSETDSGIFLYFKC